MSIWQDISKIYEKRKNRFPLNDDVGNGNVLVDGRRSNLKNRMVWVVNKRYHRPVAVIFDRNEPRDPLVFTLGSWIEGKAMAYERKRRNLS